MFIPARRGLITQNAALAGAAGGGSDPNFSSVVFLAGWEGADGATTYSEEKNSRAATFVGGAQLDTAQFKFGTSSLVLDGNADSVTFADNADWDLANANSDPYTIETWIRLNSLALAKTGIIRQVGSSQWAWNFEIKFDDLNNLKFQFSTDGTTITTISTSGGDMNTLNTWRHIAVDHDSSGKIRIFIDGVMKGSSTPANSTIHNSTATLQFGVSADSAGPIDGWLDDTRITKGVSRYGSDSSFTPPTTAFPRS